MHAFLRLCCSRLLSRRIRNASTSFSAGPWRVMEVGDYLTPDGAARRLYVAHSTGVDVLDLDRGTRIGRIEPTLGVQGVALAPDLHRGFVSCGRDSSVLVFDLGTLAP